MIRLAARIVSTVIALVCQPVPPHAKTARPTTLVGEAPSGTAETGEEGGRPTSTPDGTLSPVIPDVEKVPGWAPHPAFRTELTDEHLAYRLAVWTEEASR